MRKARGSASWDQDCWERYQWPQICRWQHLYGRKWRRTKEPLDESERGEWKSWLKAQHSERSWHLVPSFHGGQIDGETVETVAGFIFLGSKITADGDCSHEIKRHLFLGRKVMNNLDSILKSRDITLPTKVRLVMAMVFPLVMNGCESWAIKKAEHQRFDAFELWCWRRMLRVPWTARRCNQSILEEISPGCSLEGLLLKLKLQYFGHLMWRTDLFEETLMLGKSAGGEGDDRGWDGWMASLTQWTGVWARSRSWLRTGKPGVLSPRGRRELNMTEQLNWTEALVALWHVNLTGLQIEPISLHWQADSYPL